MKCGSAVDVIRHYGQATAAQNKLSLSLLEVIDNTVEWLASIQQEADSGARMGEDILFALKRCERDHAIDPDGELRELYATVESGLKDIVSMLESKRATAQRDHRIRDHLDNLLVEFQATIKAVSQLHGMMVELRWAIAEHDADLEKPTGNKFTDSKDLIASLKA